MGWAAIVGEVVVRMFCPWGRSQEGGGEEAENAHDCALAPGIQLLLPFLPKPAC